MFNHQRNFQHKKNFWIVNSAKRLFDILIFSRVPYSSNIWQHYISYRKKKVIHDGREPRRNHAAYRSWIPSLEIRNMEWGTIYTFTAYLNSHKTVQAKIKLLIVLQYWEEEETLSEKKLRLKDFFCEDVW